jgi:diguanylate cyclase (GGDEF)-like protein
VLVFHSACRQRLAGFNPRRQLRLREGGPLGRRIWNTAFGILTVSAFTIANYVPHFRRIADIVLLIAIPIYVVELNIHVHKLHLLATRDGLTGLLNKRAGYEALRVEVMRAVRGGHYLSIVYVDFNNFKPVNDQLGHRRGDEILREGARMIEANTRLGDLVVRVGGDEMYIICPDTDADGATKLKDKLTVSVRLEPTHKGKPIPVTLAAGIASLSGKAIPWQTLKDGSGVAQELLHLADNRMYEDKHQSQQPKRTEMASRSSYTPE